MKKAVFLSAILALYKKSEADVTDHLKTVEGEEIDDSLAETILKELDAEKVTSFKEEAKTRFDNGVKKGQKETAIKFEKKLKTAFDIQEDSLEGEELLSKIEEISKEKGGKTSSKEIDFNSVTVDQLEKIPAYINKQREFQTKITEKEQEKAAALEEVVNKTKNQEILQKVKTLALSKLNERNPILPQEAAKAERQKNKLLIEELEAFKFMQAEDGALIPLDEEGKPKTNANGISIDVDMLITGIIDSNFEFEKVDQKKSPGNKTGDNGGSGASASYAGKAPTSSKEYMDLLTSDELTIEEKSSIKEQYREKFV